jgi:hypothetical protein
MSRKENVQALTDEWMNDVSWREKKKKKKWEMEGIYKHRNHRGRALARRARLTSMDVLLLLLSQLGRD